MIATDFRAIATRCRRSARDCVDLFAQEEFRRLAQEFDARADKLALPSKRWEQVRSWLKQIFPLPRRADDIVPIRPPLDRPFACLYLVPRPATEYVSMQAAVNGTAPLRTNYPGDRLVGVPVRFTPRATAPTAGAGRSLNTREIDHG
jgi:hypothetical protein